MNNKQLKDITKSIENIESEIKKVLTDLKWVSAISKRQHASLNISFDGLKEEIEFQSQTKGNPYIFFKVDSIKYHFDDLFIHIVRKNIHDPVYKEITIIRRIEPHILELIDINELAKSIIKETENAFKEEGEGVYANNSNQSK